MNNELTKEKLRLKLVAAERSANRQQRRFDDGLVQDFGYLEGAQDVINELREWYDLGEVDPAWLGRLGESSTGTPPPTRKGTNR